MKWIDRFMVWFFGPDDALTAKRGGGVTPYKSGLPISVGFANLTGLVVQDQVGGTVSAAGTLQCDTPAWSGSGTKPKAAVIKSDFVVGMGATVRIAFRINIATGTTLDNFIICDLEKKTSAGNGGIRLRIANGGVLGVERSKIGNNVVVQDGRKTAITTDAWHDIVWIVKLGPPATGRTSVSLNGETLFDEKTETIGLGLETYDRVQIGITVSSLESGAVSLQIDDLTIT